VRIQSLAEAVVTAPTDGYVLDVERRAGQYVDAGAKILRTASCETAIVTAIFPISMVGDVTSNTPVTLELVEEGRRVAGRVDRILPRDSDRESEKLWVPLPPAQSNEVYVLISPDQVLSQAGDTKDCNIGSWVRVTIDSKLSRMVSNKVGHTLAAMRSSMGIETVEAKRRIPEQLMSRVTR
jgi:hypothetical protein